MTLEEQIAEAIRRFDALNASDPRQVSLDGASRPYELLHAERVESWLFRLVPDPSPALRLAARCQHLLRFRVPRDSYPPDRVGYLKWRKDLARFHADEAEKVLVELSIDPAIRTQVRKIQLKQELKEDPETQAMEDALCLAFLEFELEEFAKSREDDKVINIIQKTWRKMSPLGHSLALGLPLTERSARLVTEALKPDEGATEERA